MTDAARDPLVALLRESSHLITPEGQARGRELEQAEDELAAVLSSGRAAQLELAVYDAFDVRDGDADEFRARVEHILNLHRRLTAEQRAELGYVPDSFAGVVAVLNVAARIVELIAEGDT